MSAGIAEEWLTLKEAIYELRPIKEGTVRRLFQDRDPETGQPYLAARYPAPRQVQILKSSVEAFKEAIKDPEFWERRLKHKKSLGWRRF